MTRHGPGPLPTETDVFREAVFDHNRQNEWQGPVRYGWFDAVLGRYALELVGGVDTLAVTHLDAVPHMPTWKACRGYWLDPRPHDAELIAESTADGLVARLVTPTERSLALQARLTNMLARTARSLRNASPMRVQPSTCSSHCSRGVSISSLAVLAPKMFPFAGASRRPPRCSGRRSTAHEMGKTAKESGVDSG